jgi:hypothetical protein
MQPQQQAFLLATQNISVNTLNMYECIKQATCRYGKTVLLYHQNDESIPTEIVHLNRHLFTDNILTSLNYTAIENSLVPGSNHFSLLHYFLENPDFEFYWYIEYDAVFNGNWEYFFNAFKELKTDFISAIIELYQHNPVWPWWDTLQHPCKKISPERLVRSFNPVYRISRAALQFIHESLLDKWSGHHEVLLPTLLNDNNFSIIDFGGTGCFVPPSFHNRFYTTNTFRWRPAFTAVGDLKNKLYHPVK